MDEHDLNCNGNFSQNSVRKKTNVNTSNNHDAITSHRSYRVRNISGTKRSATLSGVPKVLDVFVGGCELSSTHHQIEEYCKSSGIDLKGCEPLETKSRWYKSYKISVLLSHRDKLLQPEFWPEGIFVRKFFKARSKQQQNENGV